MKRKFSSSKVEWIYIGQLLSAIEKENIKNMVYNALVWYIVKAKSYKALEHSLNVITLVVPILVVIINHYVGSNSIEAQIGVSITGTVAASARFFSKIHEKRIEYRMAAEQIKSETAQYINSIGEYNEKNKDEIFIKRILKIRENENKCWEKIEKRSDS